MDSIAAGSSRRLARMAGALYLINILGGAFAITIVPAMLVVQGNPAATAHNLQTHELLYRSGLAAHLVVTTTNVPLAVIFYELFKVVNRRLALLDACFILVATAIEAAGLLNQFTPLVLLGNGPYTSALSVTAPGAGLPTRRPGLDRLHHPHGVLRPRHPHLRLPRAPVDLPSQDHRRLVGLRRPGVSLLQLHRHPGPGSGSPPGSLDPAARPGW